MNTPLKSRHQKSSVLIVFRYKNYHRIRKCLIGMTETLKKDGDSIPFYEVTLHFRTRKGEKTRHFIRYGTVFANRGYDMTDTF
jgi:hypothetical protein